MQLRSDVPAVIENGGTESEMLLLQGRPIGEPVVQHGPFVMNSQLEIQQALHDYQRSEFGAGPGRRTNTSMRQMSGVMPATSKLKAVR
jgi:quercetin 2,3-dioxygenase